MVCVVCRVSCVVCRVSCVCVRWLCVCVESECGVCAQSVCVGCAFCVLVCCAVSLCVVCVRGFCCLCAVWVVCVWCVLARGKPLVCRFQTPPCVRSKRFRVYRQNDRVILDSVVLPVHTEAFSMYTRKRFEPTHGEEGGGVHFFSLSIFRRLFLFSLSPLSSLSSSLSSLSPSLSAIFDNDHSSSRLSLCTHGSDLPECQSACTLAHSLFGEHVRIMQETFVLA